MEVWDSLIRMARWGQEQGKRNVIADLEPLIAMGDEIDRLKAELASAQAQPPRPAAIVWSEQKPTEPGFYLVHGAHDEVPRVVRFWDYNGQLRMTINFVLPDNQRWAGPISAPTEKGGA